MATLIDVHGTFEADETGMRRIDDHIVLVVPTFIAEALKVAAEIMAVGLVDPEFHKDSNPERVQLAVAEAMNMVAFAKGLGGILSDKAAV